MNQQLQLSLDEFILKRSRRKTIAIHVLSDGVEVRAPYYATLAEIRAFLEEKALWILKHQQWLIEREAEIYKIKHGERITYLGQQLEINITPASRNKISIFEDTIYFESKSLLQDELHKQFETYLKKHGKEFLSQRTHELAAHYQLSEKLSGLKFRKTKSKWGHCTEKGVIQLNWLLMLAPLDVIDYVISHELCHLVHLNHSKSYWSFLESLMPDYKQRQQWIKDHGHKLYFC